MEVKILSFLSSDNKMSPITSLSDNAFSTPGCKKTRDENFSMILNPKAAISIIEQTRSLEG